LRPPERVGSGYALESRVPPALSPARLRPSAARSDRPSRLVRVCAAPRGLAVAAHRSTRTAPTDWHGAAAWRLAAASLARTGCRSAWHNSARTRTSVRPVVARGASAPARDAVALAADASSSAAASLASAAAQAASAASMLHAMAAGNRGPSQRCSLVPLATTLTQCRSRHRVSAHTAVPLHPAMCALRGAIAVPQPMRLRRACALVRFVVARWARAQAQRACCSATTAARRAAACQSGCHDANPQTNK
jgi:hypothetical protein